MKYLYCLLLSTVGLLIINPFKVYPITPPGATEIYISRGTLVREFDVVKLVWDIVPDEEIERAILDYGDQTEGGYSIGKGNSITAYNDGDQFIRFCFRCIDGKSSPWTLSFQSNLKNAEILIIGPGPTAKEIIEFIELFPDLKAIHLLDAERDDFENIDRELKAYQSIRNSPPIYAYVGNIVKLPEELIKMLKGKIDVVYEANVLNFSDFSEKQIFEALKLLRVLLKIGGLYVSVTNRKQISVGYPPMNNLFHTWAVANDPLGLGKICISIKTSDALHLKSVGSAKKNGFGRRLIGVNFESMRVLQESL